MCCATSGEYANSHFKSLTLSLFEFFIQMLKCSTTKTTKVRLPQVKVMHLYTTQKQKCILIFEYGSFR